MNVNRVCWIDFCLLKDAGSLLMDGGDNARGPPASGGLSISPLATAVRYRPGPPLGCQWKPLHVAWTSSRRRRLLTWQLSSPFLTTVSLSRLGPSHQHTNTLSYVPLKKHSFLVS